MTGPLLSVRDLALRFDARGDTTHALSGISFDVRPGEVLSLVGESGCGKSVTALAIMGLLPRRNTHLTGSVRFDGQNLLRLSDSAMNRVRGAAIGMVFQDPMTSLNPTLTIATQITEVLRRHKIVDGQAAARRRALELLDLVRIPDAPARAVSYPHELSGGMRQRVVIAIALACNPRLLIADEPTTALDVTVQAQILDLIRDLKAELGMSVILITHDLGVVAQSADRIAVMYAGRIAEEGDARDVFANPSHAYTVGLLNALPSFDAAHRSALAEIGGTVPRLSSRVGGCVFAPRCAFADAGCTSSDPQLTPVSDGHRTACLHSTAVQATARDNQIVMAWR